MNLWKHLETHPRTAASRPGGIRIAAALMVVVFAACGCSAQATPSPSQPAAPSTHAISSSPGPTRPAPTATAQPSATLPPARTALPYPVGLTDATIQVDGVARRYRIYVPTTLPPIAIVFVLHGGGGQGAKIADPGSHPASVFTTVADREGFVVVYPEGLPGRDGNPSWNDCRSDNVTSSKADDVGFLSALISQVQSAYGLDRGHTFMAGGSNGALMSYCFAYERSDLIAAIATSSGNLPAAPKPGACSAGPAAPLPVLMTHGTEDPQMPPEGGCVADFGGACNRGTVIGQEETRDQWLTFAGLMGIEPAIETVGGEFGQEGAADLFDYRLGQAHVQWWRLNGAGHSMPSQTVLLDPTPLTGAQNQSIEFAEISWEFFKETLTAKPNSP
jgi:polyhydroxybutyrate depolymerase